MTAPAKSVRFTDQPLMLERSTVAAPPPQPALNVTGLAGAAATSSATTTAVAAAALTSNKRKEMSSAPAHATAAAPLPPRHPTFRLRLDELPQPHPVSCSLHSLVLKPNLRHDVFFFQNVTTLDVIELPNNRVLIQQPDVLAEYCVIQSKVPRAMIHTGPLFDFVTVDLNSVLYEYDITKRATADDVVVPVQVSLASETGVMRRFKPHRCFVFDIGDMILIQTPLKVYGYPYQDMHWYPGHFNPQRVAATDALASH